MFTIELTNFKIDRAGFDFAFNEPNGQPVGRWMKVRGVAATQVAKRTVGFRTGHLRRSISMEQDRKGPGRQQRVRIGVLKSGAKGYALYHHEGTKPHIIRAKRGGVLVFRVRGRLVRTRNVLHPGTRANPYLTRAMHSFVR